MLINRADYRTVQEMHKNVAQWYISSE